MFIVISVSYYPTVYNPSVLLFFAPVNPTCYLHSDNGTATQRDLGCILDRKMVFQYSNHAQIYSEISQSLVRLNFYRLLPLILSAIVPGGANSSIPVAAQHTD